MGKTYSIKEIKEQKMERKRKARRRRRAWFLISEFFVLFILLGIGYVMFKYDKFQIHSFGAGELQVNDGVEKKGYTTLALFGGDSRDGVLEAGTHSDSIILVSINDETREVRMASVYRDTLTEQMSGTFHKANNGYFVGGPKEAINMLNKNFDLNIEGYAAVDFSALADAVDLLGGIEVKVKEAEATEMNRFIGETARVVGKTGKKVQAGKQTLDGVQAVTYARIRKIEGGDYKRTDRQRKVVEKIIAKAKETDLSTLNQMVDELFPKVSTSLSLTDLLSMAAGLGKYQLVDSTGFPFEKGEAKVEGAGSVVVPLGLAENVKQLHAFLYNDADYQVSTKVQEISGKIEELTGMKAGE